MEFRAHTQELTKSSWTIFLGLCKGCGLCIQKCPKKSLSWAKKLGVYSTPAVESSDECNGCGICQMVCPDAAILVQRKSKKAEE
ncbi:4Fe-4S binding protein [Desulfotomaculum defluvii]